jgi:uncharacterized protein (DUF2062 family)
LGSTTPLRRRIWISARLWWRRVLGLNDSPESIAASTAIGVFIALTPTIGIQMILSFALCCLARVNRIAGPLMAWITNPVTMFPVFWFNLHVGLLLFPMRAGEADSRLALAVEDLKQVSGFDFIFLRWEKMKLAVNAIWSMGPDVLLPLFLGSIVVGLVCGLLAYPFTRWAVIRFRARRTERGKRWSSAAPRALQEELPSSAPPGMVVAVAASTRPVPPTPESATAAVVSASADSAPPPSTA